MLEPPRKPGRFVYIVDLVNEVMENYVAFKKLKPFNVDDETSGELLSEPQHTEYKAYCILKDEVYPFTLPYHQPIDAARTYLKFFDTSRYELIKTFRKNNTGDDAELTKLKDEALDRAADAEYLGMTKEEAEDLVKMEKFANLFPMLQEQIELLTDKKTLSCPKSCDDTPDICDKDIICWVKYYFEKVGKMIVIESGRGCVDGKITAKDGGQAYVRYTVKECSVLNQDDTPIGVIDRKTGKVTFNEGGENIGGSSFIGDKGEKGIFLAINDDTEVSKFLCG